SAPDDVQESRLNRDSTAAVRQSRSAVAIDADVVSLDRIRKRNLFAAIVDVHASAGIAGNKIARDRAEAADEICPAATDVHSRSKVRHRGCAGYVRTDEISLNTVAGRVEQFDARVAVAGNEIARRGRRAADDIVCAVEHRDTVRAVAKGA